MKPIRLITYRPGSHLPSLQGKLLPHSSELFEVYGRTPGYSPILIVASIDGRPIAKLLAVIRRSVRLFPPSIIRRCEIYGTGEYFDESLNREEIFGLMLEHLTQEVEKDCFLIEFRNLSVSLFGYKHFRKNKYFPINWIRVYNSLHSLPPEERIDSSRLRQIKRAEERGVTTKVAETQEDIDSFLLLLKRHYFYKIRKHFPDLHLFHILAEENPHRETTKVFVVKHHEKVIGGSFCMFSGENAYLCFSGGLRKSYAWLYPGVMAVWAALTYAHQRGYQHLEFFDAGLPFQKAGYRNFILSFGGKQVSTRRWFRFRWKWLNRLFIWFYR